MAIAERTGLSVSATFSVAIGPKIHVTGDKGTPIASTPVLAKRLIPCGYPMAVE